MFNIYIYAYIHIYIYIYVCVYCVHNKQHKNINNELKPSRKQEHEIFRILHIYISQLSYKYS